MAVAVEKETLTLSEIPKTSVIRAISVSKAPRSKIKYLRGVENRGFRPTQSKAPVFFL